MRRAAKVDANQRTIVAAFRAHGCTVQSLAALGAGVPDLLVAFNGRNHLVEVKDGKRVKSARKLTEAQVAWQRMWRGDVHLVESVDDVTKLMERWRPVWTAEMLREVEMRKASLKSWFLTPNVIRAKGGA